MLWTIKSKKGWEPLIFGACVNSGQLKRVSDVIMFWQMLNFYFAVLSYMETYKGKTYTNLFEIYLHKGTS